MLCQILYLYSKICILGIGAGMGGVAQFRWKAFSRWGINSACRTARFLPSGRIRLAEMLAFCPAGEFGLPNCSLLGQRANSVRRTARFLPSGGIRLAEMLAFRSAGEFGSPKCSLLGQRANSVRRNARLWVSGRIRLAEMLAFGSADVRAVPTTASFR